jgi:hypothetical protein
LEKFGRHSRTRIPRLGKILIKKQIQSRCRTEILDALGLDMPVTLADRQRMPYTMATINEIQRRGNIVPVNLFHSTSRVRNHLKQLLSIIFLLLTSILKSCFYFNILFLHVFFFHRK